MRVLPIVLVLAAAPASSAQAEVARTAFGLWRGGPEERLCGAGPDYCVEFEPGGASYAPAIPTASRLYPVRFEFVSMRRGGDAVAVGGPAPIDREGDAIAEYHRNGGVTERYELSAAGVEQSFVLARRPAGDGDLVVRQRVATDLEPERTGDCSDGVRLQDPNGQGGVEIGRAVAVDAAGACFPMAMSFDGTWLELRLDHGAVEAASYPLVLDPPIGTLQTVSAVRGDSAPDVAWDETSQRYLVVWQREKSATVSEVYGQLCDRDGNAVGSLLLLDASTARAEKPTVASVAVHGRFCVVWQKTLQFSTVPPFLEAIAVDGQTGTVGVKVPVNPNNTDNIDPDLASEGGFDDEMLLVWHKPGDGVLVACGIVLNATGPPMPQQEKLLQSSTVASAPAVSKGGGPSGVHVVTWQESGGQGTAVKAMAVYRDGSALGGPVTVSSAFTTRSARRRAPEVDGDGTDFLVVYELEEGVGAGVYDVYGRGLHWDGVSLATPAAAVPIAATTGRDEVAPAVGRIESMYLVAWADAQPGVVNHDLTMRTVDAAGLGCGQIHVVRANSSIADRRPAVATQTSVGGGDRALVVFELSDVFSSALGVGAQAYQAFDNPAQVVLGTGCGLGGTISANGPMALGNLDFRIDLTGADPAAVVTFLSLGSPGVTLPCGGCTLTNPVVAAPVPITNGNASLALPLHCGLGRTGQTLEFQWVTLGSAVNACQQIPILSTSGRLLSTLTF